MASEVSSSRAPATTQAAAGAGLAKACIALALLGDVGGSGCWTERDRENQAKQLAGSLQMCGWRSIDGETFDPKNLTVSSLEGESGEGQVHGFLVAPNGYKCKGSIAFHYHPHPRGSHGIGAAFEAIRRTGEPAEIVAIVKQRGIPLTMDTKTHVTFDWKVPDGTPASVYRFEATAAGRHCVRLTGPSERFTVYQGEGPVIDPGGGISDMTLEKGPAWVLVVGQAGDEAMITVKSGRC